MRRWWCVLAALMLLLTGCRPAKYAQPQTVDFSCNIEATYRDLAVEATLTRYGAGTLVLAFEQPDTLRGLTARWDGEAVTLSLYGLEFTADLPSVPESALGNELVAALDAALRGEGEQQCENGVLTLCGSTSSGEFTATFDAESGLPLTLSMPQVLLTVRFSEWNTE